MTRSLFQFQNISKLLADIERLAKEAESRAKEAKSSSKEAMSRSLYRVCLKITEDVTQNENRMWQLFKQGTTAPTKTVDRYKRIARCLLNMVSQIPIRLTRPHLVNIYLTCYIRNPARVVKSR